MTKNRRLRQKLTKEFLDKLKRFRFSGDPILAMHEYNYLVQEYKEKLKSC